MVYLDAREKELDKLLSAEKTMLVRGAAGRKLPYGRVFAGDVLWLIENDGGGLVRARATIKTVFNTPQLIAEEARALLSQRQDRLRLTPGQIGRWGAKRYLVFIEVEGVQAQEPFSVDRGEFGNMDDWLPVGQIARVRR